MLGRGRYLTLVEDNGWEYVIRPNVTGIVVMVAITADSKLLLVEQWRPAVKNRLPRRTNRSMRCSNQSAGFAARSRGRT